MRISDWSSDVCSSDLDYSLQSRLEDALSENRIWIKLQPQIDLKSGRIVGAEALARWVDEQRGEIPPTRFIQIGRASCRARVCQYVHISVVAVQLTQKEQ